MIKNIIFDLGGVLLNVEMQKTIEAFARLGWKETEQKGDSQNRLEVFENLETGADSPIRFRENIRKMLPGRPADDEIDHAWNAMLLGFFPGTVDYLKELKSGYSLYLLSNTNALHLKHFRAIFFNDNGFPIDKLFKKAYYSHELGFRKPNPMAYLKVLEDAALIPGKTLFVDDLNANTDAAAELGMKVLNIEAGTLLKSLPDYLRKVTIGPVD
jgi:HAD superfamily hydrolase (TIGR01509 family)